MTIGVLEQVFHQALPKGGSFPCAWAPRAHHENFRAWGRLLCTSVTPWYTPHTAVPASSCACQDLCCGVDKDGKEINVSKLQAAVASLVSDNSIRWVFAESSNMRTSQFPGGGRASPMRLCPNQLCENMYCGILCFRADEKLRLLLLQFTQIHGMDASDRAKASY